MQIQSDSTSAHIFKTLSITSQLIAINMLLDGALQYTLKSNCNLTSFKPFRQSVSLLIIKEIKKFMVHLIYSRVKVDKNVAV